MMDQILDRWERMRVEWRTGKERVVSARTWTNVGNIQRIDVLDGAGGYAGNGGNGADDDKKGAAARAINQVGVC